MRLGGGLLALQNQTIREAPHLTHMLFARHSGSCLGLLGGGGGCYQPGTEKRQSAVIGVFHFHILKCRKPRLQACKALSCSL